MPKRIDKATGSGLAKCETCLEPLEILDVIPELLVIRCPKCKKVYDKVDTTHARE